MWLYGILLSAVVVCLLRLESRTLPDSIESAARPYRNDYKLVLLSITKGEGLEMVFGAIPNKLKKPMCLHILVNRNGYVVTNESVFEFALLIAVIASGPFSIAGWYFRNKGKTKASVGTKGICLPTNET